MRVIAYCNKDPAKFGGGKPLRRTTIPMYTAFISSKGNIVVRAKTFTLEAGSLPSRPIVAFCPKGDDQFDEFLKFCEESGWM